MSGSNTICVVTALIETGLVEVTEPVTRFALDTPGGAVQIEAQVENGRARRVTFENVPAFAMQLDAAIEVPGLGSLRVDLAYGGMIYAIADAAALGLRLTADEARDIARVGECIKAAAREQVPQSHPDHPEVVGPTIVCLVGPPSGPHADQRNAVVVSTGALDWNRPDTWTGALDRSPCGTATCARMAVLHPRGRPRVRPRLSQRGSARDRFHRSARSGDGSGRPSSSHPDYHRDSLGYGVRPLCPRPGRPVPGRFHRR